MKRGALAAVLVLLLLFCPAKIWASEEGENSLALELEEELVGDMELDKVQEMIDEMLGSQRFSFTEALKKLMTGKEILSKEAAWELLRGLFFSGFDREKGTFFRIFLLATFSSSKNGVLELSWRQWRR